MSINRLKWIRLLYVYPENIEQELLDFIANEEKIVKYFDIPIQHESDRILKLMGRGLTQSDLKNILCKVRKSIPNIVIRTSVMVGFPSETEAEFYELFNFVKEMGFDHLGCFTYSQEEGTRAAKFPKQIEESVKFERQGKVMEVQSKISSQSLRSYLGKTLSVLVKGTSQEKTDMWFGRASIQATRSR